MFVREVAVGMGSLFINVDVVLWPSEDVLSSIVDCCDSVLDI